MRFAYPADFEPTDDGWMMVTFPDVPGAITNGKGHDDAYAMAQDALAITLESCVEQSMEPPLPSQARNDQTVVELGVVDTSKLALALEMMRQCITSKELARRLSIPEKEAKHILSVGKEIDLKTLETAFKAIGRKYTLQVEAA